MAALRCDCDGKKRGPPFNGERAGLLIIPALNAPHPLAETTWPRDGGGTIDLLWALVCLSRSGLASDY
jgi:hypothetical protein